MHHFYDEDDDVGDDLSDDGYHLSSQGSTTYHSPPPFGGSGNGNGNEDEDGNEIQRAHAMR